MVYAKTVANKSSNAKTLVGLGLACQAKPIVVIPKINSRQNYLRKCKVPLATTLQKRLVKITMHLGLDNVIKFKLTTNFDRCAILNVLNCINKNFEP